MGLCVSKSLGDFFKVLAGSADFGIEVCVLSLQSLIFITLFRIKIVQTCFVSICHVLNLLLVAVDLVFHVSLLTKEGV